jgi:amino acid transporter
MRRWPSAATPLALYVVLPAMGTACGFAGTFAASGSLGSLWLVLGPLAGAGVSGGLARTSGRNVRRALFISLFVATLMIVVGLGVLLVFALGQLPAGFEES